MFGLPTDVLAVITTYLDDISCILLRFTCKKLYKDIDFISYSTNLSSTVVIERFNDCYTFCSYKPGSNFEYIEFNNKKSVKVFRSFTPLRVAVLEYYDKNGKRYKVRVIYKTWVRTLKRIKGDFYIGWPFNVRKLDNKPLCDERSETKLLNLF